MEILETFPVTKITLLNKHRRVRMLNIFNKYTFMGNAPTFLEFVDDATYSSHRI